MEKLGKILKEKKASDDTKAFAQEIISNLDFSALNEGQVDKFARNFSKALTDDNGIDEVFLKYRQIKQELEETGDTFTYQNKIEQIIPEMAKLLNMDEDLVRSMLDLDSAQTQAKTSLDAYLQSFGKREGMESYDVDTQKLIDQYNTFSTLYEDLQSLEATEDGKGKVTFEVEAVTEIVNAQELPTQVQDLYSQLIADGEFDQTDYQIMMNITTAMTTDNAEEREQLLSQTQKMIDELFPNSEIDIGELDTQAEYVLNEKSKEELAKQLADISDQEFVAKIKTHIEGEEDAQKFQDILTELGGEKGNIKTFITNHIGKLDDLNSYQEVVAWLLDNPDIMTQYGITILGKGEVDQLKQSLDGLELSDDKVVEITTAVESGNLTAFEKALADLPPEKQTEVKAKIQDALNNIGTVEAKQIATKVFGVKADTTKATSDLNTLDKKKMKSKTIWVSIAQTASKLWSWLNQGSVTLTAKKKSSLGDFENISNSPTVADAQMVASGDAQAQTNAFSNVSSSPTSSSSSGGLQRTGGGSGEVSSQALSSIDSVLTSKTNSTKLALDYNKVWNSVKYGIELFQELENRIARVDNNLALLGTQMENAVGTKKVSYLKQQIKLYEEQARLQKEYYNSLGKEKSYLASKLKSQGFTINDQGNLTSYEEKLIKLEQAYADAQKKLDSYEVYSGSSSSKKKASEKKKTQLENNVEKAKKALDEAKESTSRYLELINSEIPDAKQKWNEMQNAIKEANDEIEKLQFEDKIYKEKNAIEDLNIQIERLETLSDRANTRANRYNGSKKIKYLKQENDYMKEQVALYEKSLEQQSSQRADYRSKLSGYGVKFDSNGNMTNYDDILNKYQNSEDLDKIKQWMDELVNLNQTQRETINGFESLQNSIIELDLEIKQLELDEKIYSYTLAVEKAEASTKKLENSLALVEMKIERAYGMDKIKLIQEQIELNEKLAKTQEEQLSNLKKQENVLKTEMKKYGFEFTSDGDVKNLEDILKAYKDDSAFEYIEGIIEQWKELHEDAIPDAIKSVEDYKEAVKDAYDEQLDITTEIEDKITEMIEDQIDKRKEAIEEQSEAIVEALEKERDAYKAMREEAKYEDEYQEKVDTLSEISKKLEIARKDTSLTNRKKIADLEKQLEEAQKSLEEFVQDKIDSDVDQAYEDKIKQIEEENDKQIEALEDAWSESAIAEAVREALQTGLFEDLDGNVKDLQTAMLEFAQASADHFSVMGQSIENDLIANLNVALDTVDNLSDIMKELGIPELKNAISVGEQSNKYLTVNGITISIPTTQSADPVAIAEEVQKAVEEALRNATQGL